MKTVSKLLLEIMRLTEFFFRKGIIFLYVLLGITILYVLYALFIKDVMFNDLVKDNKFTKRLFDMVMIYHYLLKLSISLYLIMKFNPYIKIKYESKSDNSMIFNCALLLFTSTAILDPILYISQSFMINI